MCSTTKKVVPLSVYDSVPTPVPTNNKQPNDFFLFSWKTSHLGMFRFAFHPLDVYSKNLPSRRTNNRDASAVRAAALIFLLASTFFSNYSLWIIRLGRINVCIRVFFAKKEERPAWLCKFSREQKEWVIKHSISIDSTCLAAFESIGTCRPYLGICFAYYSLVCSCSLCSISTWFVTCSIDGRSHRSIH